MYIFLILLSFQTFNKIEFTPIEFQPIAEYTQIREKPSNTKKVTPAPVIVVDNLVSLHNNYRTSNGLSVLTYNSKLTSSAQAKANDMCANNYWAHSSPTGVTPWYWITQAGYDYDHAGENLARNFSTDQGMFNAWLKSSTHLANIVGNYKNIGIGRNACGGINYTVVHFGTLVGE